MSPSERAEFEQLKALVHELLKPGSNFIVINKNVSFKGNKLGFFQATPIEQPTASTGTPASNIYSTGFFADTSYGNNEMNQINNMWNAMIGLGLIEETA